MYVYAPRWVSILQGGQRKMLDALELVLQMIVSHCVGAGNWAWVLCRSSARAETALSTIISPAPIYYYFNIFQFIFFFFKDLFIILCKYTVAVFRHTRRGSQILLQMVVSHHVVAGIWTLDLRKSNRVLLPTEPSHQPSDILLIPALGKQRQANLCESETWLVYIVSYKRARST
jgi:hypothetical protein